MPASDVNIASFLSEMFDQAPTFMALLQGPEHRFQLANPSYLELVDGRDVIGKTVAEALPEADAQGFVRILDEVYQSGKAYTASGARFAIQGQREGPISERFLDFVYQPLIGPQGGVTGIFVQGSDTTERSLAERRLSESTALYKGLFDAIDEGFCIIEFFDGPHGPDSDYIHIEANAAYARHAGIPNVVGQKLREMVGAEADSWVERYGAVLRTGTPIRFQQELVATGRFLELAAIRIEPASKRQVAVLFQDITARRQASSQAGICGNVAPPMRTEPCEGASSPVRSFSKVDLPAPLGPTTIVVAPSSSASEAPRTKVLPRTENDRSSASRIAAIARAPRSGRDAAAARGRRARR